MKREIKKITTHGLKNFKPHIRKNSHIGKTFKMSDNDLPHKNADSNKIVNLAVIEENGDRVGGVRMTTRNNQVGSRFKSNHPIYKGYKHFLETKFNDGSNITASDKRLKQNSTKNNLSQENINEVKAVIYTKAKQKQRNVKIREELKTKKSGDSPLIDRTPSVGVRNNKHQPNRTELNELQRNSSRNSKIKQSKSQEKNKGGRR